MPKPPEGYGDINPALMTDDELRRIHHELGTWIEEEQTIEHVEHDKGPCIADMDIAVDRRSADIHPHPAGIDRLERFLVAAKRVVELQRHLVGPETEKAATILQPRPGEPVQQMSFLGPAALAEALGLNGSDTTPDGALRWLDERARDRGGWNPAGLRAEEEERAMPESCKGRVALVTGASKGGTGNLN